MFKAKITPLDGTDPYEVEVRYGDAYVWEKTGKGRSLPQVAGALPAVPMYELALIAAKRIGKASQDLSTDDFAATHECVPVQGQDGEDGDAEELDPTPATPSPTP